MLSARSRWLAIALMLLPLSASAGLSDWLKRQWGGESARTRPDADTVSRALKEALSQGTRYAVTQLGREDGYLGNRAVRIPMPAQLLRLDKALRRLGQERYADEFIVAMNRAAEAAVPQAVEVLLEVIRGMTIGDAFDILNGPEDAATRYFRRHSEDNLQQRFLPIVAQATERVGVTRHYKRMVERAGVLQPWASPANLDLDRYVTEKALEGLYYMIAREEARIRADPAARTTDLLRKVFGR